MLFGNSPSALQFREVAFWAKIWLAGFCRCPSIRCLSECWNFWKWLKLKVANWRKLKILPGVIIWTFLAPNWSFFLYACFRGVFGVGGKEWALDEEKKFLVIYITLEGGRSLEWLLSWLWVKIVVVLGWRENSSLGVNSSAPVFANVISEITQGLRVSGYRASWTLYGNQSFCGPAIFEKLRLEPRSGLMVFVGAVRSGASPCVENLENG